MKLFPYRDSRLEQYKLIEIKEMPSGSWTSWTDNLSQGSAKNTSSSRSIVQGWRPPSEDFCVGSGGLRDISKARRSEGRSQPKEHSCTGPLRLAAFAAPNRWTSHSHRGALASLDIRQSPQSDGSGPFIKVTFVTQVLVLYVLDNRYLKASL